MRKTQIFTIIKLPSRFDNFEGNFIFYRFPAIGAQIEVSIVSRHKGKAKVNVEEYRKLVSLLAWKAYVRLPAQDRIWLGVEDLIEDGMRVAVHLSYHFNHHWAQFQTYLYHQLHRYYINEYLEKYSALKRGWMLIQEHDKVKATDKRFGHKRTIDHQSLEALTYKIDGSDKQWDETGVYWPLVTTPDHILNNAISECFAVPALSNVYQEASPKLKEEFVNWFWQKRERACIHSKPFKKLASEFKCLCFDHHLSCDDCLHVIRSPQCLDSLSRTLFDIPYDLNHPTPSIDRIL